MSVCGQERADYAFVIDGSGSIHPRDFTKLKKFVKDVVEYLLIGPEETHVGLIEYSTTASLQLPFNELYDSDSIKRRVDRVEHKRGLTRIDLALRVASEQLFTTQGGMRSNARKVY